MIKSVTDIDAAAPPEVLGTEDIRLLVEIGFMACGARHVRAARAIFDGLETLRPGRAFIYVGSAMTSMSAGNPDEAVRLLREEGLRQLPGNEELLVFLAMALQEARCAGDSRRVLQALVDRPGESTAPQRLALALLRPSDEGLPSPMRPSDLRARKLRSI